MSSFLFSPETLVKHKILSQLLISHTQTTICIVFVPLLLRWANDIEESPGPTVYDIVDPNKTISADFSQGNIRKFKENAGKQCVAMCVFSSIT